MAVQLKDWFARLRNLIPNFGLPTKKPSASDSKERLSKTLGKFEKYIYSIQSILIWDDPVKSALYILGVNLVFWFLVSFQYRFYGVVFTTILAVFCYDLWVERVWPEISVPVPESEKNVWTPQQPSSHVLSVPEISSYVIETTKTVKRCYHRMVRLRQEQPAVFCGEMCGIFVMLSLIGRTVSGCVIGYCLLMLVLIGPGIYIHLIPPAMHARLAETFLFFQPRRTDTDSETEDMLPEATMENMALFRLAGEPDISDKEDSNEFALGPDLSSLTNFSMHSPCDDHSLDDIADFESRLGNALTDSDSDEAGIHFRSSHFNGNSSSSSEDDDPFAQGLTFTDSAHTTDPQRTNIQSTNATLMSGLAQNLTSLGASLLTSVINRAAAAEPPRRRSSADSEDFEMISKEELS